MKNFDGIIFDIDGTLASTHELVFESFNYVINKYYNKKLTTDEIIALFGPTEDVILKEWMKEHYENARKDYYEFYESQHNEMANIFPGLEEVIKIIKSKRIPLGIFTGKGRDTSIITLKAIKLYDYFDLIITGDDVKEHKPSPEGINKFLSAFNLKPERTLMVGDTPTDIIASRGAGVKCALVLWDDFSRSRYSNSETDFIFYSVEEFKEFIINNI
ncbi:HAD family hydrolase [Rosettibacter firmus]|uniref:HAD family hydrolase n=1 Tax=Rosettibacter firmus TaxID=3111522 RepID=UPI00336BE9DA